MKKNILIFVFLSTVIFSSCKKKVDAHIPPDVSFKTASGYLSKDSICSLQDTLKVGLVATKTEDDLKSFNVSVAYDGSVSTNTFYNYLMNDTEYTSYSKDIQIVTRNQPGSEKWIFSIVDRDGNITQKEINLTVQ